MDFDAPAQQERDLRGANQEFKRHKDHVRKWQYSNNVYGTLLKPGIKDPEEPPVGARYGRYYDPWRADHGASEPQTPLQVRPNHPCGPDPHKEHKNISKLNRMRDYAANPTRMASLISAHEELEDASRNDLSGSAIDGMPGSPGAYDPFLYSFDSSATTPGQPLSLDVFVKQPSAKDTEKLVAKEYEVVDGNGLALKGREAKQNLRKSGSSNLGGKETAVEDGFELV